MARAIWPDVLGNYVTAAELVDSIVSAGVDIEAPGALEAELERQARECYTDFESVEALDVVDWADIASDLIDCATEEREAQRGR